MATTATITGAQFDALPYEEGRLWELVEGELIPVSSTTFEHQLIVGRIFYALLTHLLANADQGTPCEDVEFALDENNRVRPDVFVLSAEHLKAVDLNKVPVPGAPDLAVEVISPSERPSDSQRKAEAYLHYGALEVWQVYAKPKTVVVHRGSETFTLECGSQITTPLLPGFSVPVESIFP